MGRGYITKGFSPSTPLFFFRLDEMGGALEGQARENLFKLSSMRNLQQELIFKVIHITTMILKIGAEKKIPYINSVTNLLLLFTFLCAKNPRPLRKEVNKDSNQKIGLGAEALLNQVYLHRGDEGAQK